MTDGDLLHVAADYEAALRSAGGEKQRAAQILGIKRTTFHERLTRMQRLGYVGEWDSCEPIGTARQGELADIAAEAWLRALERRGMLPALARRGRGA